ncbi:MAG: hypothetical protein M1816_003094 [Peltula sp. TS41687]|nr:MAG: hypothetical protein M1816_003094 [Peltula sp. TS41687]
MSRSRVCHVIVTGSLRDRHEIAAKFSPVSLAGSVPLSQRHTFVGSRVAAERNPAISSIHIRYIDLIGGSQLGKSNQEDPKPSRIFLRRNTQRSHHSGEVADDPADSGPTVIPGTQPATFQAAQPRDVFENPLATQSTTTPDERSREDLPEEISRLQAGNRELRHEHRQMLERRAQELHEQQARLKEGLSTQRAERETDDPAQSDDLPSRRRRSRRYTLSSSSGSGGDRPAKRSKADRAKQVPPLPKYHGKNWAEYYSYASQIKLNCEYKPSIAPTERDKDFKEFLSSLLEHPALRGLSAADGYENARQRAGQTTDNFATYLDQLEEELEPYKESHRRQHLLTKLRLELKQAIKAYPAQPETRYELVSLASRLEQNIPECRPSGSRPRRNKHPASSQRTTWARGSYSGKGRSVNQTSPSSSSRQLRIEEKVVSSDNKGKPL